MAKEYVVQQLNYQNSANADSYSEDSKLAVMVGQGWQIHTADIGSWPYVTFLWEREVPEEKPGKAKDAD